jgi:hypothetical protein
MYKIGSEFWPKQLVFIDKILKDERSLFRAYRYNVKNVKVEKNIVFVKSKKYNILLALTLDGFIVANILERSCNKERFQTFILIQVVCYFLFICLLIYLFKIKI